MHHLCTDNDWQTGCQKSQFYPETWEFAKVGDAILNFNLIHAHIDCSSFQSASRESSTMTFILQIKAGESLQGWTFAAITKWSLSSLTWLALSSTSHSPTTTNIATHSSTSFRECKNNSREITKRCEKSHTNKARLNPSSNCNIFNLNFNGFFYPYHS